MNEKQNAVKKIREFNRAYTRMLGLLNRHILNSGYSLTEARILFELYRPNPCSANGLVNLLGVDRSYMSRILKRFEQRGLIERTMDQNDSRVHLIELTQTGRATIEELGVKSDEQVFELIRPFQKQELAMILHGMDLFMRRMEDDNGIRIRNHKMGDFDYVIARHQNLYTKEYNLSPEFCVYVDKSVRYFQHHFDDEWECLLVPELHGQPMGSIAIAKADQNMAQLRYFLLEPQARGKGLGHKLMDMALDFCRQKGYGHIFLQTCSDLLAARHLYNSYGFVLTDAHANLQWGEDILEERWEMDL